VKDEHVKDAAQDVAQDVAKDVPQDEAQDLVFGARAVRALLATPPPPPPPSKSLPSSQLAEMGRSWAARLHLAWALGKRYF